MLNSHERHSVLTSSRGFSSDIECTNKDNQTSLSLDNPHHNQIRTFVADFVNVVYFCLITQQLTVRFFHSLMLRNFFTNHNTLSKLLTLIRSQFTGFGPHIFLKSRVNHKTKHIKINFSIGKRIKLKHF